MPGANELTKPVWMTCIPNSIQPYWPTRCWIWFRKYKYVFAFYIISLHWYLFKTDENLKHHCNWSSLVGAPNTHLHWWSKSSWTMQMSWCQIGTRPSAITMLTQFCVEYNVTHIISEHIAWQPSKKIVFKRNKQLIRRLETCWYLHSQQVHLNSDNALVNDGKICLWWKKNMSCK